jgi:hypothetical protein
MTPDSRLLRSRASIKEYSVFPSRASQWMIVAPVDVSMDARRSLRNAASKAAVFQWPCGTLATSLRPRGAQL